MSNRHAAAKVEMQKEESGEPRSARTRIFDKARELFYRHGIRAVGVQTTWLCKTSSGPKTRKRITDSPAVVFGGSVAMTAEPYPRRSGPASVGIEREATADRTA